MAALAQSIPGRVGSELAAVLKLTGGLLSEAARAQDVPALGLLLHAEGAAGRYPATLALLSLATALVGSGDGRQELQVSGPWAKSYVVVLVFPATFLGREICASNRGCWKTPHIVSCPCTSVSGSVRAWGHGSLGRPPQSKEERRPGAAGARPGPRRG